MTVLGYVATCDCGQAAITSEQVRDWQCPACVGMGE